MSRELKAAAVFLLAVLLAAQVAAAGQPPRVYVVDFYLAAVDEAEGRGSLLPARLTVTYPGSGSIAVTAGGGVDDVTRLSMEQAVKLGALLAGVDWRVADFSIEIETEDSVGGPSGSAMVALVVYAVLSGSPRTPVWESIVVTGAVSPEGLVSSVGGVEYKCEAAADEGLTLYYPLVNLTEALLAKCPGGRRYTGLLNLTASVFGSPLPAPGIGVYPLPASFNYTMREAAARMAEKALELLSRAEELGLPREQAEPTRRGVELSLNLSSTHPYAAASLAFTALLNATRLYYAASALTGGGINKTFLDAERARVAEELARLRSELDAMPREGSIFYVEFAATAYTRLAAANSSLLAYNRLLDESPQQAIYELAHASARIYSIREWISSARASIGDTPRVARADVERLAYSVEDYVETAAAYAESLAEYLVENRYRSRDLLVYIDIIKGLVEQARNFMDEGDYIAAVGFYREALSRSLDMLFQASIGAYNGPEDIIDDYMVELERVYTLLSWRLLSRGAAPGLAPAYYDYGLVLLAEGKREAGLLMMEESASSAILWSLLALAPPLEEAPQGAPGAQQPVEPEREARPLVTMAALVVAFAAGYLASIKATIRVLERL